MRWFRDPPVRPAPRGTWLRTLVVLVLVWVLVAETPLPAAGGLPSWLTLGGTSTVAGSQPPFPGAPGVAELAAAKGKHNTKRKDKRDKTGKHDNQSKDTTSPHDTTGTVAGSCLLYTSDAADE